MLDGARSIVMMGATGAVGNHVARMLAEHRGARALTLLGRRPADNISSATVAQHTVDLFDVDSYAALLPSHDTAICTVGVGEPSKVSREEFVRVDHDAVLAFGGACRKAGVSHFQLLSSVGANARSSSFYLRVKGELEDGLEALGFDRLSLFEPSAILTPTNRYGFSQGLLLAAMPVVNPLLIGALRKFRGVPVARLGRAMALNTFTTGTGREALQWDAIMRLSAT